MTELKRAIALAVVPAIRETKRSDQDGRRRANKPITHTTCKCGARFTYRQSLGHPRTLCAECTLIRQIDESSRIKELRRDRVKALPKTWNTEVRRAYVSAEGHLTKCLIQMLDIPPAARAELLMRFMAVSDEAYRARALPPRNPQSD